MKFIKEFDTEFAFYDKYEAILKEVLIENNMVEEYEEMFGELEEG